MALSDSEYEQVCEAFNNIDKVIGVWPDSPEAQKLEDKAYESIGFLKSIITKLNVE